MTREVAIEVSAPLRRSIDETGDAAEQWLAGLPAAIGEICRAWQLRVVSQLQHAGVGSVTFVVETADRTSAVLKLTLPHEEARHEAAALRRWNGDGAARVRRHSTDGYTLLLERCEPGHDLWAVEADEQLEVMATLLPRLWRPPEPDDPFDELTQTVARWERQMLDKGRAMGLPDEVAADARRWARRLRAGAPRRLLHGDFHPGNVLAAERGPWLAIDPKPWIGDPAFDLAQALANWGGVQPSRPPAPAAELRGRAHRLADRLALDPDRILRWAVVKGIGWNFGRDTTLVLHQAARPAGWPAGHRSS